MILYRRLPCAFSIALASFVTTLEADPEPERPEWDLEEQIAAVNESELRLLGEGTPTHAHMHENRIRISPDSLADGWVALEQCHERLDAVPRAQIVFNPERIRDIRITGAAHIARAWVEGHTVQLEDIASAARLCISANSHALTNLGEGYYRLRTGPYMRRFLDGYYPMRVMIDIEYPAQILSFVRSHPMAQPGFALRSEQGRIRVDASFEGKLYTCLDFSTDTATNLTLTDLSCTRIEHRNRHP